MMMDVRDTLGDALSVFRKKDLDDLVPRTGVIAVQLNASRLDRLQHDIDFNHVGPGPRPNIDGLLTEVAGDLVNRLKASFAYVGCSSITLLFEPNGKNTSPTSYFELAMEAASVAGFSAGSRVVAALNLSGEDDVPLPIQFHGDVFHLADRELASRFLEWRQSLNHREVTLLLGRRHGVYNDVVMKSLPQRRDILIEAGADLEGELKTFLHGSLVRRRLVRRLLTDREIARLPTKPKSLAPVTRPVFTSDGIAVNFALVDNLVDVAFDGVEPVITERRLAQSVSV